MARDRLAVWVLAALVVPSCSVVLSYPAVSAEDCTNGRDDDLDGDVDCDDLSCVGACPEESAAECENGRDDDGDGFADALDPRCWPYARVELERCATVSGSASTIPATAGVGWDGVAEYVIDPTGTSGRPVVGAIERVRMIHSVESFTGGWAGTSIETRVYLEGDPVGILIVVAGPLVATVGLQPGNLSGASIATADGERSTRSGALEIPTGWAAVAITVSGPAPWIANLAVTPDATGTTATTSLVLPDDWPVADAFSLEMRLTPTPGTRVLLDEVVVARPEHRPCGRDVPEVADHVLYATTLGRDRTCAMGEGRSGVLVSTDGERWTRGAGITDAVGSTVPVWDADASVFRGAAIIAADDGALTLVTGTSDDCDTWTTLGPAFATAPDAPALPRRGELWTDARLQLGYGYLLRRLRPGEPLVHEVWVTATDARDDGAPAVRGIVRGISPDGSAGSFVLQPFMSLEEALGPARDSPAVAAFWGARVSVSAVAADRAYLVGSTLSGSGSVSLFVEHTGALREIGSPLLAPSGVAGTFDEHTILYGFLRMDDAAQDDVWAGEIVYGRLQAGTTRVTVRPTRAP